MLSSQNPIFTVCYWAVVDYKQMIISAYTPIYFNVPISLYSESVDILKIFFKLASIYWSDLSESFSIICFPNIFPIALPE